MRSGGNKGLEQYMTGLNGNTDPQAYKERHRPAWDFWTGRTLAERNAKREDSYWKNR